MAKIEFLKSLLINIKGILSTRIFSGCRLYSHFYQVRIFRSPRNPASGLCSAGYHRRRTSSEIGTEGPPSTSVCCLSGRRLNKTG